MIPNAPVEFRVQTHVGRLGPVALFRFLAEQCPGPLLGCFIQTNPIAFELQPELQRCANGQITWLGVHVVDPLKVS